MEVIKHIADLKTRLYSLSDESKSLGLVPTMGALHAGHLSLIHASVTENDFTAASLFVNPAQFNNAEDFNKYPSSLDRDLSLLDEAGADLVFAPERNEMYPEESLVSIDFGHLSSSMEGKHRPGHFNGVALIVSKLFNLFNPTMAYFGQKDLQQFYIINRLNEELNFGIKLRMMPTIRETTGLAMSSRNERLSTDARNKAAAINVALDKAVNDLKAGISVAIVCKDANDFLLTNGLECEYFEVVHQNTLSPIIDMNPGNELACCVACYLEGVRLIDNRLLTLS